MIQEHLRSLMQLSKTLNHLLFTKASAYAQAAPRLAFERISEGLFGHTETTF